MLTKSLSFLFRLDIVFRVKLCLHKEKKDSCYMVLLKQKGIKFVS